jgi:hypothetical protein
LLQRPDLPWFAGGTEAAIHDAVRLRCRRAELEDCHAWADAHDEDGIWG